LPVHRDIIIELAVVVVWKRGKVEEGIGNIATVENWKLDIFVRLGVCGVVSLLCFREREGSGHTVNL